MEPATTVESPDTPELSPEELEKQAKKRTYVIQEIISTELTYIERLKMAIDHIVTPLRGLKVLDQADISGQFGCLERIYELHSRNSVSGSTSQNLKFVELFNDMSMNFHYYTDYLVNYEPAMQRRGHLLTSNRRFADFILKVEKDPLLGQSLESLLILPVQRIPRYRLLLEQLLKYTPESHSDYNIVKNALDKICDLASYNNEAIRVRENKNKIMSVMMQIDPTYRIDLLGDRDRKFIKDALLLKQCRCVMSTHCPSRTLIIISYNITLHISFPSHPYSCMIFTYLTLCSLVFPCHRKRYKEFQFWLLSDVLLYGERLPLGTFALNRQIPLNKCKASPLSPDDVDFAVSFILQSPAKSFKVKTKSEEEKKEWISSIAEAIEKQRNPQSAAGDTQVAPLWKPDSNSNECELCHTQFTLLFRRHHCRNCGALVCVTCSNRKFLLEHVHATNAVRVCDNCYGPLTGRKKGGE
ncbi:hypothetical protein EON64_13770, partial [archaeon]